MNTVEILEKAAELIKQGWCQGAYARTTRDGYKVCSMGAIQKAANGDPYSLTTLSEAAIDRLTSLLPDCDNLADYNDLSSTTKEDVLLLFKKAIYEYES